MVFTPVPVEVPEVDSEDNAAQRTKELFRALDKVRVQKRGGEEAIAGQTKAVDCRGRR